MLKSLVKRIIRRRRYLVVKAKHLNGALGLVNDYLGYRADLEVYETFDIEPTWAINFVMSDYSWDKFYQELTSGKYGMVKTKFLYFGMLEDVVGA